MIDRRIRKVWCVARNTAKSRGVVWQLSLAEFTRIWLESGHWLERGCRRGQYCMARYRDKGAYVVGNVRITTVTENHSEFKQTLEEVERIRQRMQGNKNGVGQPGHWLGKSLSPEVRQRMSHAKLGNQNNLGNKASAKTRKKMRAAQLARRKRERALGMDMSVALYKGWDIRREKIS